MGRITRISGATAVALSAVLILVACGGEGASDGGATGTGAAGDGGGSSVSTITLIDNEFQPSAPVVAAGDVELVNDGDAPHTFTVEGEDVDVEVPAGETASATLDLEPGTYALFCEFHRAQGMETTLTVQ